ncbi:MAG: site-2 protease family protein, partial [Calditrichaeota bacterium]|nr:site-2 protease family protein [Calditrichota bacterium]
INDTEVRSINDFLEMVRDHIGETFQITYRLENGTIKKTVIPETLPVSKQLFFPIDGIFASKIYVRRIAPNTLAEQIQLQKNDTITHINHYPINSFNGLIGALNSNVDKTVDIDIKRGLDSLTLQAHLLANKDDEVKLGFYPGFTVDTTWFKTLVKVEDLSFSAALQDGLLKSYAAFAIQLKGLIMMVKGDLSVSENLGGPVAIANEFSKTVGNLDAFLSLVAVMSLALAFFNLLPLPVFDGGSLVIVLLEGIRGRELETETKLKIQRVGFLFIIMLMIFVFTNDISRLF